MCGVWEGCEVGCGGEGIVDCYRVDCCYCEEEFYFVFDGDGRNWEEIWSCEEEYGD